MYLAKSWHLNQSVFNWISILQIKLGQDGIDVLGKAHMHSTLSLRSFPNIAFEMVMIRLNWMENTQDYLDLIQRNFLQVEKNKKMYGIAKYSGLCWPDCRF